MVETVWAPLRLSLTAEWVMETNTNADDAAASGDTTALARVKCVCDMLKAQAEIVEAELLAIAMWGMLDGARNEYARLLNLPAAPQPLDRAVDDINADTSIAAMQGVAVRRLVPSPPLMPSPRGMIQQPRQFEAQGLHKGTPYQLQAGGYIEAMLHGGKVIFANMRDFTTAIDDGARLQFDMAGEHPRLYTGGTIDANTSQRDGALKA